jgi:hypothetical protein
LTTRRKKSDRKQERVIVEAKDDIDSNDANKLAETKELIARQEAEETAIF